MTTSVAVLQLTLLLRLLSSTALLLPASSRYSRLTSLSHTKLIEIESKDNKNPSYIYTPASSDSFENNSPVRHGSQIPTRSSKRLKSKLKILSSEPESPILTHSLRDPKPKPTSLSPNDENIFRSPSPELDLPMFTCLNIQTGAVEAFGAAFKPAWSEDGSYTFQIQVTALPTGKRRPPPCSIVGLLTPSRKHAQRKTRRPPPNPFSAPMRHPRPSGP